MHALQIGFCFFVLIASAAGFSSSSSESCEDKGGRGGGRGGENGVNRGCSRGWHRFKRSSGGWCVRVFSGKHSQADAESRCKAEGATLSGLQNQAELNQVSKLALSAITQASGSIWLGLKRTAACRSVSITKSCTTLNSFQWTDGHTTGVDGLIWNGNQPDNNFGHTQHCGVLLVARTPTIQDKWTWQTNRLDDESCAPPAGDNGIRAMRGYVCGKRATS